MTHITTFVTQVVEHWPGKTKEITKFILGLITVDHEINANDCAKTKMWNKINASGLNIR